MIKRLFILFFLFIHVFLNAAEKLHYDLTNDALDVVIACHPKDKATLDYCIDGIIENSSNPIRRIIVISPIKLTDKAEWFSEDNFPFNKNMIIDIITKGNKDKAVNLGKLERHSPGWYFQQLLKLYSIFVIPDISSNVLIIDADVIFMNPVEFLSPEHGGYLCYKKKKGRDEYFKHAQRLIPSYERMKPKLYSVCHHMLFQKPILEDLFNTVESFHKVPFWTAFCSCVDFDHKGGASEYEIYYSFALSHTKQVRLRYLKWKSSLDLDKKNRYKKAGYHFISFHSFRRESDKKLKKKNI